MLLAPDVGIAGFMRGGNNCLAAKMLSGYIGSRCSLVIMALSLIGFALVIHLYSMIQQTDSRESRESLHDLPVIRELEKIEEESFKLPPHRRKHSPHAGRRSPRKPYSVISGFLDASSELRSFFFPDQRTVIDPNAGSNDDRYFYPGRQWLDTAGNPIQAHGGGLLYDEDTKTYYWYGEIKDGQTYRAHRKGTARVDIIGVNCYSSKDLWAWKNEGIVLSGDDKNTTDDLYKLNVLERPKVIYNDQTGKYVMWMHIDDTNYTKASVGVAISDHPTGPFNYLFSKRPHGFDSRDMTVFKDDNGSAYLVYSSKNNGDLHIGPLTEDYLDVTTVMRRVVIGRRREAPALFKHGGTYYMITSGCSGWAPNPALVHAAESILGPWETIGNPCVGGNNILRLTTFFSQSTFVLPLQGLPGYFIFMADRWNSADLRDSRYVWLPLTVGGAIDTPLEYSFGFPLSSTVSVYWHRKWRLPQEWGAA